MNKQLFISICTGLCAGSYCVLFTNQIKFIIAWFIIGATVSYLFSLGFNYLNGKS